MAGRTSLGLRIEQRRRSLGLTHDQLARQASCGSSMVGSIERNYRIGSLSLLKSIANALDLTLPELLEGTVFDGR